MESAKKSEQNIRVGVDEAARLFGVSSKSIRRALTQGALRYVVVRGRYKISFASLVNWSQQQPGVRRKRDEAGIGQWISQWRIRNTLYSPRPPETDNNKS